VKQKTKRLNALMKQLSESHQQSVVDFAGYLVEQYPLESAIIEILEPQPEQRPANETVVGAIKRLKKTYPMLDTDNLLNKASALMGQHILQGREAEPVIDDLQNLFESSYEEYRQQ
jgi:hypothetical protein